nr:hypothetical protein [Tanacetum cinerariifolium]
ILTSCCYTITATTPQSSPLSPRHHHLNSHTTMAAANITTDLPSSSSSTPLRCHHPPISPQPPSRHHLLLAITKECVGFTEAPPRARAAFGYIKTSRIRVRLDLLLTARVRLVVQFRNKAHADENKMMLDRFNQHTVDPLALMSNVSHQQHYSQSSSTPPSTFVPPHLANNAHLDSGLSPMENLIENLTNTLALLTQSYKTFIPQTNNQLRTSSNTRNQATFQDGRVVVQNVQGRQNRGQGTNPRGGGAAGMGKFITELRMLIQVKQDKLSATTATV